MRGVSEEHSFTQAMRKKLPPPENTLSQASQPSQQQPQQQDYLAPEDYVAQDEIYKVCRTLMLST